MIVPACEVCGQPAAAAQGFLLLCGADLCRRHASLACRSLRSARIALSSFEFGSYGVRLPVTLGRLVWRQLAALAVILQGEPSLSSYLWV